MATQVELGETARIAARNELIPVYVWQLPVRLFHWLMVIALLLLTLTGFYMHSPFLEAHGARAWVMGTNRFVHELAGFVLIAILIMRIYWFFAGNHWAHWRAFVPLSKRQWQSAGSMVSYYGFQRREPVAQIGHNALAAMSYLVIYALLLLEVLTGLILFGAVSGNRTLKILVGWIPRYVDIQWIRATHFLVMFAFMAFMVHHIYSAVLVAMEEKNGLMESIFTGWKFVPRWLLQQDKQQTEAKADAEEILSGTASMQIAVLGLGNLMRTDDALGMLAIEHLKSSRRLPPEVRLIEGGTLGLDLLDALRDITHLIALDVVDSGLPPGTLMRFANDELALIPVSRSVHLLGFADLINVLRLLGAAPPQIVLLGVQPLTIDWGTELTTTVAAALPELLHATVDQVAAWHGAESLLAVAQEAQHA